MIVGWFENRPKDEIPPEHIWEDTEGLEEWWTRLEHNKEIAGSMGAGVTHKDVEESWTQNELVRAYKDN